MEPMSASPDHRPTAVDASGRAAVAAAGNVGQAFTGPGAVGLNIGTAHLMSPVACPQAESIDCPPGLNNLRSRATMFVGRADELTALDDASTVPGEALAHVLHGLGGIGKSTLAARWASRHSESNPDAPAWWIRADSRSAIDTGLADLAIALQPSLFTLLPQEQLAEWALRWLASHTGWLLVLDDVSNPDDVTPLLSRATSGRFLITSRQSTGWRGIAKPVPLDVLPDADAVELFALRHREDPDAAELCEELGHLPLAIAQVAAYCEQSGCTAREYLEDLADLPAEMYAAKDENRDHEHTVARVWHVTLDRLADDPLTARILLTLAWYAPDGIPRTLLGGLGSRPAVRGALGRLAAHSMVTLSADGDTVSVHRLVQAVSRTKDTADRHRSPTAVEDACTAATEALGRAVPDDVDDPSVWSVMRALLPHVEELARHTREQDDSAVMARLLTRTGDYMLGASVGLIPRALALLQRAEAGCVRLYGPDSEETLDVRVQLTHAQRMSLDIEQAAEIAERTLADCLRVLGTEHPLTFSAQLSAYKLVSLAGDAPRALTLAREALAGRVRVFGEDDHRTFAARGSVVMALAEAGDPAGAQDLASELLDDCVRALGEEHPQTLATKSTVMMLAQQASLPLPSMAAVFKFFNAAVIGEGVVTAARDVVQEVSLFGPMTLARPTEEDVAAAERNLETCLRVLGEDHADTFSARMTLLSVYAATQDERYVERGVRHMVEALTSLGEDHPITGFMLNVFQALHAAAEDWAESGQPDLDAGPEHPQAPDAPSEH
jgi:hypothetical protein